MVRRLNESVGGITIGEIIRTASNLDDEIRICAGSLKRKDSILEDSLRRVPEVLKNAHIRNWAISTAQGYGILVVEIDDKYKQE